MNEQTSSNIEGRRAELDVLLAEYKSHRDEIFKWYSYRHQAVGGYLAVLSIIGTIAASGNLFVTHMREILIALVYVSLALLYVLFQCSFPIRSNTSYVDKHLSPRIRKLCVSDMPLEWVSYCTRYRKASGRSIVLLTKFSVEAIPHFVILVGLVALYVLEVVCEDRYSLLKAPCLLQKMESFLSGAFWYGLALVLWVWISWSFSFVSQGLAFRAKEWITRKVRGRRQKRAG